MPAPMGKHPAVVRASRPWKGEPQKTKNQMVKTSQSEIDICLQCKRVSCKSGECEQIRMFDRRLRMEMRPVPADFLLMTANPDNTIPVLAMRYGVSEYMVRRWRQAVGIKSTPSVVDEEEFVRDARSGMRLRDIMDKYRIGSGRAHNLYAKHGIEIPPKGTRKGERK